MKPRTSARLLQALLVLLLAFVLLGAWLYRHAETVVLAAEAYVFGTPLVMMSLTREASLHRIGPENQLQRVRQFPQASFREVVRPNVDTLYTTAFIDLAQGPWVFHMPAGQQRYTLMAFLDGWTDVFAALGTRTQAGAGGTYLLLGPGQQAGPVQGMTVLRAGTRMAWLIGRIQTLGPQDLANVHALQDGLQLIPLHDWQTGVRQAKTIAWQPTPAPTPPLARLLDMPTPLFFEQLAQLMQDNPPRPEDAPMLRKLARLGVQPGQTPAWGWGEGLAVRLGRQIADFRLAQELRRSRAAPNGWQTPPDVLGRYGTGYNIRAAVARMGLGANAPEDAMYPQARVDAQGQALHGRHRYRLHFAPGALPPVKAFWSITAYGLDDYLLDVPGARHAIRSSDPLVFNADGSLDLLIQSEPPGTAPANWLAVRADQAFLLNARLYWPTTPALQGHWQMPSIERLHADDPR